MCINNSVDTKKGKREGTTDPAQRVNPVFTAGRFTGEKRSKQNVKAKKAKAKKLRFTLITQNWHFENMTSPYFEYMYKQKVHD